MQNTSTCPINQHTVSVPLLFCAVVGPTASGKSDLALRLAERTGCALLSVDAMQVYRTLDVGTAKPSPREQARVPHYGIDLADPLETFNASRYVEYAEPVLQRAWERRQPLILCGGTGLYYRALLEGLFEAPRPDPEIREHYLQRARIEGSETLHCELREQDPATAAGIHPRDAKRITRALEILAQTGCRVSELRAQQTPKPWLKATCFLGLRREKEDLKKRIHQRTQWMYNNGLIEETRHLLDIGGQERHTAFQALGYKECAEYIRGRTSMQEAFEQTVRNTERYAKRQMTWFRLQFPTQWIDVRDLHTQEEIFKTSLQVWGYSVTNNTL